MAPKENELIQQLLEKTRAKAIDWEPTAKENEFVSAFKGNVTFTVSKFDDPNYYGDCYRLLMRDSFDREMLTIDSKPRIGDVITPLGDLYKEAHDSALKVEETIDAILNDLRQAS